MTPPQRRVPHEDHALFDELAVGWALHALEPEDEAVFAQHLPGCRRCAHTVAETSEVMAAMAADLPRAEPSAQLRDRLSAAVAETEQVAQQPVEDEPVGTSATGFPRYRAVEPDAPARSPLRRRLPSLALVAAAVLVILGLGIWNVFLADSRDDLNATVAQQEDIVNALLTPGVATVSALSTPDGEAVATVVARSDRVDVVVHGLSANDTDSQTYVLWGLDGDTATALGPFDVTGSQVELETVGSGGTGLDDYSGYGISIEPGREPPPAPTDIVATGER
jgi:anti-sigma-K factor RskA